MASVDNFDEEFERIRKYEHSHLVANELKSKSLEFREFYRQKTRQIRNNKYRQKNKDDLNALRRQKYKNDKIDEITAINHIITPIILENVDTTVKREYRDYKKMKDLSQSTLKTYGDAVKAVYFKYHNKTLDESAEILKYLRCEKHDSRKLYSQNKYIIDNIENIAENYATNLPKLYSLFSRFNTKKLKEFREVIYPYAKSYQNNYQEHRHDLEINHEEIAKISFVKEDVLAVAETIENINHKLLYMLVFMMPVRRLNDYRITYIAEIEDDLKKTETNWYYEGKIWINNTKNGRKIVLNLPDEIVRYINDVIIPTRIRENHNLLVGEYSQPKLTEEFGKLTKKLFGSQFNANDIRKVYASFNLKTAGETGDVKQMLQNQNAMGHSLAEHLEYVIPSA